MIKRYIITNEDVYISIAGTIGLVGVAPPQLDGANLTENAARLVIKDREAVDKWYLVRYLSSELGQREIAQRTTKTSQPKLALARIKTIPVLLPSLPEQRAIAHVLRTIQQAKEATEKVIAAARQLKQSLMRHLFTYGPVPVDKADKVVLKETEVGPVPQHWEVRQLQSVAELVSGGTPSKARPDFWQGPIPWVSPKDMKLPRLHDVEDHISQEAVEEGSRLVPAGSLFIVIRGMILAKDLPVALAMVPMAFNQDMKAILPKKELDSEFLLYALTYHKARLIPEIGTSAHGTKRIGTAAVNEFFLPLPPIDEQKQIAAALGTVDHKIAAEQGCREALGAFFQSSLHHLMTGQVRVINLKPTT